VAYPVDEVLASLPEMRARAEYGQARMLAAACAAFLVDEVPTSLPEMVAPTEYG